MYYESTKAHLSHIKHLWHSSLYVCTLSHATPITTDPFLQAIIISNALIIFIVVVSSYFVVYSGGGYKLNE